MYSKYNIYLKNYPKKDFTTIFNLRTQEVVCYADNNLFPEPNKNIEEKLLEKGICCMTESAEISEVIKKYNEVK